MHRHGAGRSDHHRTSALIGQTCVVRKHPRHAGGVRLLSASPRSTERLLSGTSDGASRDHDLCAGRKRDNRRDKTVRGGASRSGSGQRAARSRCAQWARSKHAVAEHTAVRTNRPDSDRETQSVWAKAALGASNRSDRAALNDSIPRLMFLRFGVLLVIAIPPAHFVTLQSMTQFRRRRLTQA